MSMCLAPTQWPVVHCNALFQNKLPQLNRFSFCLWSLALAVPSSRFFTASESTTIQLSMDITSTAVRNYPNQMVSDFVFWSYWLRQTRQADYSQLSTDMLS